MNNKDAVIGEFRWLISDSGNEAYANAFHDGGGSELNLPWRGTLGAITAGYTWDAIAPVYFRDEATKDCGNLCATVIRNWFSTESIFPASICIDYTSGTSVSKVCRNTCSPAGTNNSLSHEYDGFVNVTHGNIPSGSSNRYQDFELYVTANGGVAPWNGIEDHSCAHVPAAGTECITTN